MDAALQLHQERLRICEALGDKRSRAVTLGIFEALGDSDGKANTLWSIAQIEMGQEKWQEAYEHLAESYAINLKLGRLDGICFVGLDLGQLVFMAGQRDEGLAILTRSRDGFAKLGRTQMAQQTQALLDQISKLPPPS